MRLAALEAVIFVATAGAAVLAWEPGLPTAADAAALLGRVLAVGACCGVAFYYSDLYDLRIVRSIGRFAARLLNALAVATVLIAALYALAPVVRIPVIRLAPALVAMALALCGTRAALYALMRSRQFAERVLVVGTGPLATDIISELESQTASSAKIVGVADDAESSGEVSRYAFVGPLHRLDEIIRESQPDRIIVALSERRGRLPVRALLEARMRGIAVEDGVEVYERLTGRLALESLRPSNLIFSRDSGKFRLATGAGRLISLVGSVIGLAITSPVLALIAVAIKLDSPGPVFFVQERAGVDEKRFALIKFRTMHPAIGPTSEWAEDNRARITRVGKWLRKYRLDELPQFINILRGDMNIVGPRPHPTSNVKLFGERIPYYQLRLVIRPGVTGWAQIRYGYANSLEEELEKMRYDLFYIKHLSIGFDLQILVDTVKIVLFGRESIPRVSHPAAPGLDSAPTLPAARPLAGSVRSAPA